MPPSVAELKRAADLLEELLVMKGKAVPPVDPSLGKEPINASELCEINGFLEELVEARKTAAAVKFQVDKEAAEAELKKKEEAVQELPTLLGSPGLHSGQSAEQQRRRQVDQEATQMVIRQHQERHRLEADESAARQAYAQQMQDDGAEHESVEAPEPAQTMAPKGKGKDKAKEGKGKESPAEDVNSEGKGKDGKEKDGKGKGGKGKEHEKPYLVVDPENGAGLRLLATYWGMHVDEVEDVPGQPYLQAGCTITAIDGTSLLSLEDEDAVVATFGEKFKNGVSIEVDPATFETMKLPPNAALWPVSFQEELDMLAAKFALDCSISKLCLHLTGPSVAMEPAKLEIRQLLDIYKNRQSAEQQRQRKVDQEAIQKVIRQHQERLRREAEESAARQAYVQQMQDTYTAYAIAAQQAMQQQLMQQQAMAPWVLVHCCGPWLLPDVQPRSFAHFRTL
ncbi:Upf1 [Symbiodinium sp. CCMP2592]|nr:Upf1 [Symbiodinium sp. CCMP2592]